MQSAPPTGPATAKAPRLATAGLRLPPRRTPARVRAADSPPSTGGDPGDLLPGWKDPRRKPIGPAALVVSGREGN